MAIPYRRSLSLAASCIAFVGCASQPTDGTTQDASIARAIPVAHSRAPIATSPEITSTWVYLKDRYDSDGDGIVTTAEYDRREGQFERWDRDEDGTLTGADFEPGKRRSARSSRNNPMLMGKARRTLARYFQDDDDAGKLPLTEAKAAFAVYDGSDGTDADGILVEGEFTCSMEDRHREVPGDNSPTVRRSMGDDSAWANLIAGLDRDKDKALSAAEIEYFYATVMKTAAIDYSEWNDEGAPKRKRSAGSDGKAPTDDLAAQVGQKAPDFTLASPSGDQVATLSQHIGSKPVALIFGSYT